MNIAVEPSIGREPPKHYTQMSHDELLVDDEVLLARQHIETSSGGYDFEDMGLPRLLPLAANPGVFNLSFSPKVYRFLRKEIQSRRENDTRECLIPAITEIVGHLGGELKNTRRFNEVFFPQKDGDGLEGLVDELIDDNLSVRSEGQLLYDLAHNESLRRYRKFLPDDTRAKIERIESGQDIDIRQIANDPIRMIYLSKGENLENHVVEHREGFPIVAIGIRIKTYESMFLKMVERYRRIYAPTDEELISYTRRGALAPTPRDVYQHYEAWLRKVMGTGNSLFDTIFENSSTVGKNNFGNKMNERFWDPSAIDSTGSVIVVEDDDALVKMSGVINNTLQYRFKKLKHKNEDFTTGDDKKDSSTIWGITSSNEAQCSELRGKTIPSALVSQFGSDKLGVLAENDYKKNVKFDLNEALRKKRPGDNEGLEKLIGIIRNCELLFNLRAEDVGIIIPR